MRRRISYDYLCGFWGQVKILQALSLTLFEQVPILQAFGDRDSRKKSEAIYNQLKLLDL
jgi:hypothetical protein